jgi:hypothetical protein
MPIPGNLLTTAMAVMPHMDPDRALEMALSVDVPFWPKRALILTICCIKACSHPRPAVLLTPTKKKPWIKLFR